MGSLASSAGVHRDTLWSSSLPDSSQSLHARISVWLTFNSKITIHPNSRVKWQIQCISTESFYSFGNSNPNVFWANHWSQVNANQMVDVSWGLISTRFLSSVGRFRFYEPSVGRFRFYKPSVRRLIDWVGRLYTTRMEEERNGFLKSIRKRTLLWLNWNGNGCSFVAMVGGKGADLYLPPCDFGVTQTWLGSDRLEMAV